MNLDGKLKQKAQLYREIELTLPRELDREERIALVENYVKEQFVDEGMIADIAIHNRTASDGLAQPHAHIMLTMRKLEDRPDKLERGIAFGNKVRDWNDSDQQIAAMAEAKRKRGQLQNDVRRYWRERDARSRAAWSAYRACRAAGPAALPPGPTSTPASSARRRCGG